MAKFNSTDNRGGRPRGARNKLAQSILRDLLTVWDEPVRDGIELTRGIAALRVMAVEDPSGFCKLFASLMPRELTVAAVSELGDSELDQMIERLQNELIEQKVEPKMLEFTEASDYERVD
jgi:hypothetical protein